MLKGTIAIRTLRVLIIDDEFLIRWSLTQALAQEGYEVVAEDGKRPVEEVEIERFDFIITDLIMPEWDGWKILEVAQQARPAPRVIIMTAFGKDGTESVARERGAWAYVEKPFIIDRVKEILKEALNAGTSLFDSQ